MSDLSGRAWSEDPSGQLIESIVVDFEVPAPDRQYVPTSGPPGSSPLCDERTLADIRSAVLDAEARLRAPATIRWRLADSGRIEVVESEAISEPLPWGTAPGRGMPDQPDANDRWSRANVGEIIPNVMTPFSWSAAGELFEVGYQRFWRGWGAGRRFVAMYDGYVYFNFGLILELVEDRFGLSGQQLLEAVGGPEADDRLDPDRQGRSGTTIHWSRLLRRLPFLIRWLHHQHRLPPRWLAMRDAAEAERDRLKMLPFDDLSDREIVSELSSSYVETERQTTFAMLAQTAAFSATQGLFWALGRWLGAEHRNLSLELLQGVPGVRTQEGNLELRGIAWRVAQDEVARAFVQRETPASLWSALHSDRLPSSIDWLRESLDRFMDEYGHRGPGEMEAAEPRWVDQPELILSSFCDYVRAPERWNPQEVTAQQRRAREAAGARIRELLRTQRFDRVKWRLINMQIHQARRLQPLRENPKFTLLELALQQLRLWRALAGRWVERGLIAETGDVYYLQIGELETLADRSDDPLVVARMTSRIRRRRLQHLAWSARDPVPLRDHAGRPLGATANEPGVSQVPTSEPEAGASARAEDDSLPLTLRGIAASSGVIQGLAHVADSVAAGRRLAPGEILVARFTDPGWTPIFATAAAVVTEIGGVLSHGAIVARELGIPAVVNVQRVTRLVRPGDLLRVDGASGRVTILSRQNADTRPG